MKGFIFGFGFGMSKAISGLPFVGRFLFNGYPESIPGYTYSGGALWIKDLDNALQETPSNVIPSGGRLAGGAWSDTDTVGRPLHPYLYRKVGSQNIKDYRDIALRQDTETLVAGDERQWDGFYFVVTVGGDTGTGNPATGSIGDTGITDGTVTWTNYGHYKLDRRYANYQGYTNRCLIDYPRPEDGAELSSGSPTVGIRYRISAQSIVDFTTVGASSNVIGTEFVASGSGVTLSSTDRLVPIESGLDTYSYHNGSSFIQNITNLSLSGDTAAILRVVSVIESDLISSIDANGEDLDLTSFVQTHNGDYLAFELDNSSGVTPAYVGINGFTADVSPHTGSVVAYGEGALAYTDLIAPSVYNVSSYTRILFENKTPTTAIRTLVIRALASKTTRFLIPNLTKTTTAMPILEANTTRAANVLDAVWPSNVTGGGLAVSADATPMSAGQSGVIWSSYVDADNWTDVYTDADNLYFRKRIAGVEHISSVAYTHLSTTKISVQAYADGTGIGIRYRVGLGSWSAYGTNANTDTAVLSSTVSIGHRNGSDQFNGYIAPVKIYSSKAEMEG